MFGCGEDQTMSHLLYCRLLDDPCTLEDLFTVMGWAKVCARKRQHVVQRTRQEELHELLLLCRSLSIWILTMFHTATTRPASCNMCGHFDLTGVAIVRLNTA